MKSEKQMCPPLIDFEGQLAIKGCDQVLFQFGMVFECLGMRKGICMCSIHILLFGDFKTKDTQMVVNIRRYGPVANFMSATMYVIYCTFNQNNVVNDSVSKAKY